MLRFVARRPPALAAVDTLSWLLLALALAVAPHAQHFPVWVTLAVACLGGWRAVARRRGWRLPPPAVLLTLAAASAGGVFLTYSTLLGRDAGVAMLALMLGLKLMELRNRRDMLVAIFLAYFLVATHFLYSQTVASVVYMVAAVLAITAALVSAHDPGAARRPRQTLRLSAMLLLQALPLALALFVLFPRVPGPLWGLPKDAYSAKSGLSDQMAPGSISSLILSDEVAFRVEFRGPPPRPGALYWRGPVLWHTDGRRWTPGFARPGPPQPIEVDGSPTEYSVTLEPNDKPWLFALDLPVSLGPGVPAFILGDYQLIAREPVKKRLRYQATSHLTYRTGALSERDRQRALQLPRGVNPRATALARGWREQLRDPERLVQQALAHFRAARFVYSLDPPMLAGDTVDQFLFETREGFCEHYAAAFTWLMRAAGVPARVVTGYQGGDMNPLARYMIVRQSDAHAWSEVWLEGRGWVRVDPTALVSPLRVESGIRALERPAPLAGIIDADNAWLRRAAYAWDAANNIWNIWILGYNKDRQFDFLSRFGIEDWKDMALALSGAAIASLLLAWAGLALKGRPPDDPVRRLYGSFCGKLAACGLPRRPAEGPLDYALRVCDRRPDLAGQVEEITRLYIGLRYAEEVSRDGLETLRRKVRVFRA